MINSNKVTNEIRKEGESEGGGSWLVGLRRREREEKLGTEREGAGLSRSQPARPPLSLGPHSCTHAHTHTCLATPPPPLPPRLSAPLLPSPPPPEAGASERHRQHQWQHRDTHLVLCCLSMYLPHHYSDTSIIQHSVPELTYLLLLCVYRSCHGDSEREHIESRKKVVLNR